MGLILLEEHTALPSTTLDFTAFISPLYDDYEFHFSGINPTISNHVFAMRMGTGPGPTFDPSSAYTYDLLYSGVGDTPATAFATFTPRLDLTHSQSAGGLYSANGRLRLYAPQAARHKHVEGELQAMAGASLLYDWHLAGVYVNPAPVTGVQFFFETGDIAAGGIVRAFAIGAAGGRSFRGEPGGGVW